MVVSMKEHTIRVGFIGAGGNTRLRHLPGFKAIPGVELALVANRSEESSQRIVSEYGVRGVAKNWRALLDSPNIDAVCIGTWPYMHAEISIAALKAGKHVLTEARMACNALEAEQMVRVHKEHPHLVAQIVPAPMTLAFDKTIRRMVADKMLGSIREVIVAQSDALQIRGDTPMTWRQDQALSGHNIMTLGIHYEALLRWFQEDAVVDVVSGEIFSEMRKSADGGFKKSSIPESITVLGHYPSSKTRLLIHLSGLETSLPRNEIRINGTKGGLRLDLMAERLFFMPVGGDEQALEPDETERGGWQVEQDFIRSIRKGDPVTLTDFETGLRYMRFTDAVWEKWEHSRDVWRKS